MHEYDKFFCNEKNNTVSSTEIGRLLTWLADICTVAGILI